MRTRSIRHRKKKRSSEILDLDITSLLDILVVMLLFLLKNYNSSGVIINVPDGIELPQSASKSLNVSGVNIQVSNEKIFVDDKVVYEEATATKKLNDMGLIYPLYDELVAKKNTIQQIEKTSPNAQKFTGLANLVVDKSVRYNLLQKLMHTCASAGFRTYKFVVMSKDQ